MVLQMNAGWALFMRNTHYRGRVPRTPGVIDDENCGAVSIDTAVSAPVK
jgi:hypothetical protein